jgi:hypothetical protein
MTNPSRLPRRFRIPAAALIVLVALAGCRIAPAPRDASLWDLLPQGYQGYGSFEMGDARPIVDGILADWFPNDSDRQAILDRVDRIAVALPLLPGEQAPGESANKSGESPAAVAVVAGDLPALAVSAQLRRMGGWSSDSVEVGGRRYRYWTHAEQPLELAVVRGGYLLISRGDIHKALAVVAGTAPSAALPTESRFEIDKASGGLYVREPSLELPSWLPTREARLPIVEMTVAASPTTGDGNLWTLSGNVSVEGELNARVFATLVRFLARRSQAEMSQDNGAEGSEGDEASPIVPSLSVEREGTRIDVRGFIVRQEILEENLLHALRLLGYG